MTPLKSNMMARRAASPAHIVLRGALYSNRARVVGQAELLVPLRSLRYAASRQRIRTVRHHKSTPMTR
ncbi:hypothetical protein NSND_62211 [Nitrospira sp. ND1]|nr:hypothetical protein NSND_62211 [Nitrospira sp. ND1]